MSERFDVIVVGVGAMGSATCYELAHRGVRVLGLEQFDVPHGLGSSGGQSRLTRLAYFEHPDYVPLLRRAWERWEQLGERAGVRIVHRTGILYLGRPEQELLAGVRRAAAEHELAIEQLTPAQVRQRCGPFRVPDGMEALWEDRGGFVLSERAIAAYAELTLRAGGQIRARERVLGWQEQGNGVSVQSDRGRYEAAHLVLCAGAWTEPLVRALGVPLRVTRQLIGWVWPEPPEPYTLGSFSCWAIQDDEPGFSGLYYGFPLLPVDRFGGERGLKLAHHVAGAAVDPDTVDRTVGPDEEAGFRPALRKYLPGAAEAPTLALKVCMYTNTPDGHFILDQHPEHRHVTLACGFSGHGFKFASAVGEVLADLATEGRTELPIEFLSLARFRSG